MTRLKWSRSSSSSETANVHGLRLIWRFTLIDTEVITMTVPAVAASITKLSSSSGRGSRLPPTTSATSTSATA
ncbi:hypothetical protein [Saccharopolyspora sp. NPDC002376]